MKVGDLVRINSDGLTWLPPNASNLGVIVQNAPDLYHEWHKHNPEWASTNPCWMVYCFGETYKFVEQDLEVIRGSR